MIKKALILLAIGFAAASCRKPYDPPAIKSPRGYLVVEGIINAGSDSTVIKMSRTVNLDSLTGSKPELNAIVTVLGNDNTSYPLTEIGNGKYASPHLNLDNTKSYCLSIKTANNEACQSAYLPVLNSPPIDSVSFDTKGALSVPGLNVYVNTHDPAGKVVYYRWAYSESWIFSANFESNFYSNGDTVLLRNLSTQNITDCWGVDSSSDIILGSTAKLSRDVIYQKPLTSIVSTSEKVGDEYSILVTQYALTADAYNFYTNLQKNTESLGSIFDPEPSQINGNITCSTNPAEAVIGYISVGASTARRIFITTRSLPSWHTIPFYTDCELEKCCLYDFEGVNQVNEFINYDIGHYFPPYIPIDQILQGPHGPVIGYTAASSRCADCTLRGTNKRPAFWQ